MMNETTKISIAEPSFELRAYLKSELAQRYNPCLSPRGALRKLNEWIRHNPELYRRLHEEGPEGRHDVSFTLRQVRLLVEYLGEP